jgi:hypothetical protein
MNSSPATTIRTTYKYLGQLYLVDVDRPDGFLHTSTCSSLESGAKLPAESREYTLAALKDCRACHSSLPSHKTLSFVFNRLRTLLKSQIPTTPIASATCALFAKNTPGWGASSASRFGTRGGSQRSEPEDHTPAIAFSEASSDQMSRKSFCRLESSLRSLYPAIPRPWRQTRSTPLPRPEPRAHPW